MKRDCRENMDINSTNASGTYQYENMHCNEANGLVTTGDLPLPEGNENAMHFSNNHSVRMDGQLDATTYINEERYEGCLAISDPSTTTRPILANKRKLEKSTKSSSNGTKCLNQTKSSGQRPGCNAVSNFQSKTGVMASRRARAEKQEGQLVQTQKSTIKYTKTTCTSVWRSRIQANSPSKIPSLAIKKNQSRKSSSTQFIQSQQSTTQSTKMPKPSTDIKKTQFHKDSLGKVVQTQQSTPSTSKPSRLVWRSKVHGNPPPKISSMAIKKTQIKKNLTSQPVQPPESTSTSTKKPSTSLRRGRVQANSQSEIYSQAIRRTQSHKNSVGQLVRDQQITTESTKKPSTSVQRKTIQVNSPSKLSSVAKKTLSEKDSAPQKVWREKTKKKPSSSKAKRSRLSRPASPVYHITRDGVQRTCQSVTENCCICERDLSSLLNDKELEYYNEYNNELEPAILPVVAVLACGHVFHSECLDSVVLEDQSSDPPCFLCLSHLLETRYIF